MEPSDEMDTVVVRGESYSSDISFRIPSPDEQYERARTALRTAGESEDYECRLQSPSHNYCSMVKTSDCSLGQNTLMSPSRRTGPEHLRDFIDNLNQARDKRLVYTTEPGTRGARRRYSSASAKRAPPKMQTQSLFASMQQDAQRLGLKLYSEEKLWEQHVAQALALEEEHWVDRETAISRLMYDSDSEDEQPALPHPELALLAQDGRIVSPVARSEFFQVQAQHASSAGGTVRGPRDQRRSYIDSCQQKSLLALPLIEAGDSDKFECCNYQMGPGTVEAMASAWIESQADRALRVLRLSGNSITEHAGQVLMTAVGQFRNLEHLDLSNNPLGSGQETRDAIASMLSGLGELQTLNLSNTKMCDRGVCSLASALSHSPQLTELRLCKNSCSAAGAAALGSLLAGCTSLQVLTLSYNAIGAAAGQLVEAVGSHKSLQQLDLSWNGVDDAGASAVACALECNSSLLVLDLGHNKIQEQGASVLFDCLRGKNSTLQKCCLDANSLGQLGGRAATSMYADPGISCQVSIANCSFQRQLKGYSGGSTVFDPDEPNGHYDLDLSIPFDVSVAKILVDLAYGASLEGMRNLMLDGHAFELPRAGWEVPTVGTLRFDYVHTFRMPGPKDVIAREGYELLRQLLRRASDQERLDLLSMSAKGFWFDCSQLEGLCDVFVSPAERVQAVVHLFPRVVDPQQELRPTVRQMFSLKEQQQLRVLLGAQWDFNWMNPTGKFTLDLQDPNDRQVMRQLLTVSAEEKRGRALAAKPDMSQHGNAEGFRNEILDGSPVVVNSDSWTSPPKGKLKFDFVWYQRPPGSADPMPEDEFTQWKNLLRKWACRLEQEQPPVESVEVNQEQEAAPKKGKKGKKKESEEEQPAAQHSPLEQQFLSWVREESTLPCAASSDTHVRYLEASQIQQLLTSTPTHLRAEVLVLLWGRLVDEENSSLCFRSVSPEQFLECFNRLGALSLFNPLTPEGPYKLDLEMPEDNMVGRLLMKLGHREEGDNMIHEMYRGNGFETPATWLTDFPNKYVWEFTYVTEEREDGTNTADMEFRRQMAIDCLGWEFDDDDNNDNV